MRNHIWKKKISFGSVFTTNGLLIIFSGLAFSAEPIANSNSSRLELTKELDTAEVNEALYFNSESRISSFYLTGVNNQNFLGSRHVNDPDEDLKDKQQELKRQTRTSLGIEYWMLTDSRDQSNQANQTSDEIIEGIPDKIVVHDFVFNGGTVFDDRELEDVIQESLDIDEMPASLTFSQLLQARTAITEHYIEQGYITSGAYIPEQSFNVEDGIIEIYILEGTLNAISVRGLPLRDGNNHSLSNDDYYSLSQQCLERQLRIDSENPPIVNQENLLNLVRLIGALNSDYIQSLGAELVPTNQSGQSRLEIEITRNDIGSSDSYFLNNFFDNDAVRLTIDNSQSPSVGSIRYIPQLVYQDPLGGDLGSLSLLISSGSTGAELALNVPIENFDLPILEDPDDCNRSSLQVKAGFRSSEIIEEPFNDLDIQSSSGYADFRYRQEERVNLFTSRALGTEMSWRSDSSSLLGIPFPLTAQANQEGINQLIAFRAFIDYLTRDLDSALFLASEASVGTTYNFDLFDEGPNLNPFLILRGQAEWQKAIPLNMNLLLGARSQFSIGSLSAVEKLAVGGRDSVRGYRENFLLFDNGLLLSSELQYPILRSSRDNNSSINLIAFFDFGTGWNNTDTLSSNPDLETLLSTGVGLSARFGDHFNSSLIWGIPLTEIDSTGDSLQDQGIYFSVTGTLTF